MQGAAVGNSVHSAETSQRRTGKTREGRERDALRSDQAVHQHLLHHEYNKKHVREPGSNRLESCPLDFQ